MPGTPKFGVVRKQEFGVETGLRIWLPDFQVPSWFSIMTTVLKILIIIIFPQNKQSFYKGAGFQWKVFSFLLKYNPHTISCYFQVYIIVIWYLYVLKWSPWCLYTTSPYKITTVLWIYSLYCTLYSMIYLLYSWKFIPFNSLYLFSFPIQFLSPLETINLFSVSVSLFLFCFVCFVFQIPHTVYVKSYANCLSLTYFT